MNLLPTTAQPGQYFLSTCSRGHFPRLLHPALLLGPATLMSNSNTNFSYTMRKESAEMASKNRIPETKTLFATMQQGPAGRIQVTGWTLNLFAFGFLLVNKPIKRTQLLQGNMIFSSETLPSSKSWSKLKLYWNALAFERYTAVLSTMMNSSLKSWLYWGWHHGYYSSAPSQPQTMSKVTATPPYIDLLPGRLSAGCQVPLSSTNSSTSER